MSIVIRSRAPIKKEVEMLIKYLLTAMLALMLSACGGGFSVKTPHPAVSAATGKKVLIEAYGDSTMYGLTNFNGQGYWQVPEPAPAILQSLLHDKYGPAVTVTNLGVSGETAIGILNGDGMPRPWLQQMAQSKADIIIINPGINDSNPASKEPLADFELYESRLVQIARDAGKTVIVENANPVTPAIYSRLAQYVATTNSVAREAGAPLIDQFSYLNSLPNWSSVLSDGIHPTQEGYRIKAQAEFATVDRAVAVILDR